MKRIILLTFVVFVLCSVRSSGAPVQGPAVRYELGVLTCAPGDELHSAFGHTALRVKDLYTGTDEVFNFGTFDFQTPNFYLKFVRGNLDYQLSRESFSSFVDNYTFWGRGVIEQRLDLPGDVVEGIVAELYRLYEPENRAYRYKFIRRNCTTAVRDLILPYVDADAGLDIPTGISYRRYIEDYMYRTPWVRIGINLIMGSKVDRDASFESSMFLPDILADGLDRLSFDGGPLVGPAQKLNNEGFPNLESSFIARFYPALIVLAVCMLVILCRNRLADNAFLSFTGFLGLLICFLMFFCGHMEFKSNLNLLWCNPLLLAGAYAVGFKRPKTLMIITAMMSMFVFVMLVVWAVGAQGFETSYLMIAITAVWILLRNLRKEMGSDKIFPTP